MAFLDKQTRLGSAQAFSASGATTDYYDASSARNLGDGEPMALVFTVTTGADYTTTDETYTFALQCDDNTGFSTPLTCESRTVSAASSGLVAGTQVVLPIPTGLVEQYVRGYLTLGGTTPSISVTTDIVPMSFVRKPKDYPSSFTVY
jgi:hypothetical protein